MDRQTFGALASRLSDVSVVEPNDAAEIDTAAAEHVAQLLGQAVLSAEGRCPARDSAAKVSRPCCVFKAWCTPAKLLNEETAKRNSLCPWK